MAYPIKNTGVVQTNSIKPNNFALGVNQGGYGLTSVTAFWNGRPPNVTGYIVYVGNGTNSPTMYTVATDSDLIQLSNTLGGGSNNTIQLALNYFINSADSICLNNEPLNIVTSGLGLYLDAGFTPSFPKGINTWYDLSGSGNTGTLVNGPAYSSEARGSIVFDGIDDGVDLSSTITLGNGNWSVGMWVSAGSFNSDYGKLLSNNSGGPVSNAMGVTNGKISYQYYLSSWNEQLGNTSLTAGNWYYLTWVNSSNQMIMYVNGAADSALFTSTTNNGGPVNSIGRNWFSTFPGKISSVKIYQGKSLTPAEILQNYYAGLQRFIPTDGLSLWLDGQNTNTRVITPTTAYDTSGNNYNGTLTNGVSLKHRDAGTVFSFDGVDDYILVTGPLLQDSGGTINVWAKVAASPSDANIVGAVGNSSNRFYIRSSFPSNTFKFVRGTTFAITSGSFTLNTWYNLTMTWNSSTFNAYLNGNLLANLAYTSINTTTNVIYVGAQNNTANFFNGNVGEIQIYSRVLTATEILSNYTADKTRYGL